MHLRWNIWNVIVAISVAIAMTCSSVTHAHASCAGHASESSGHHIDHDDKAPSADQKNARQNSNPGKTSLDHCCGVSCLFVVIKPNLEITMPPAHLTLFNAATLLRWSFGVSSEDLDPPKV